MQEVLDALFRREIDASRISWLEEVMGKLRKFQQCSLEVLRYWYSYGDGSVIGEGAIPPASTFLIPWGVGRVIGWLPVFDV